VAAASHFGTRRPDAERSRFTKDKLEPLLRDLADHPLSLELVGPHLRTLTPEAIRADFGKLLDKFQQTADQGRNRSLLASLEFSRRHLSPAARAALPWLGLFSGGVFEDNLLDVSQIEPAAWEPIRTEFQGIALLRTEDDIQIGDRPFLRFHPTLAIASADSTLAEQPETRQRFIDVYLALMQGAGQGAEGFAIACRPGDSEPRGGQLPHGRPLGRGRPAAPGRRSAGAHVSHLSGNVRPPPRTGCLGAVAPGRGDPGGLHGRSRRYERQHAWTLFTGGDPQGAVDRLQALVERLRHTTEFDPAFQLAMAIQTLGRVLYTAALPPRPSRSCTRPLATGRPWWNALGACPGNNCWPRPTTPRRRPNWATSLPRWAIWPMP
jgi:hypothetical protein